MVRCYLHAAALRAKVWKFARSMPRLASIPLLALLLALNGCSATYYAAAEQLGWAQHDVLANRIQLASDALEEAAARVTDAARSLGRLVDAPDGELAARFQDVQRAQTEATALTAEVPPRLAAVEGAGQTLFDAWATDIAATTDAGHRARDQALFALSQQHYVRVLGGLHDAEGSLTAVLAILQAQIAPLAARLDRETVDTMRAALPALGSAVTGLESDVDVAVALSTKYVGELELSD